MVDFKTELAAALSDKILHLTLLPTEECNFRCTYCYEHFNNQKMDEKVINGIQNLIAQRLDELNFLSISWFGGEPLLESEIILRIMFWLQNKIKSNPSLIFRSDITTNGFLLTPSLFEQLVNSKITNYQITFDGPEKLHDKKRITKNKAETYKKIWSNLNEIRYSKKDFNIQVRLHIDNDNCNYIKHFLDDFSLTFGNDSRFTLFIRPLSRLGGKNDGNLNILEPELMHSALSKIQQYACKNGIRYKTMEDLPAVCYSAKSNCFVIRADGTINKCTVALENPLNQIGSLKENGKMILDEELCLKWLKGLITQEKTFLKCPLNHL